MPDAARKYHIGVDWASEGYASKTCTTICRKEDDVITIVAVLYGEVAEYIANQDTHIARLLAECERLEAESNLLHQCSNCGGQMMSTKMEQLEADRRALVAYVRVLEHDEDYYSRGPLRKDDVNPELRDAWQALGAELQEAIDGLPL